MGRWLALGARTAQLSALGLMLGCASTAGKRTSHDAAPLKLAACVNLDRYMGRWYVIANIPYFAERGKVGSYVEYRLLADGTIDDIYVARHKTFDAKPSQIKLHDRVVPGTHGAEWRARPFWPVDFPYPILYVDPAYRYALVGYPDRSKGWVFSRTPQIAEQDYQDLLARFAAQGYDIDAFKRVPQTPAQIGVAGFQ